MAIYFCTLDGFCSNNEKNVSYQLFYLIYKLLSIGHSILCFYVDIVHFYAKINDLSHL